MIISTIGKFEELVGFVTDCLGLDKRYAIDPTKLEQLDWNPLIHLKLALLNRFNGI